ncbi:unnamed protein product [Paramecium pentaurelia]|uniref:Uncharacterized protein n=1 Tax=Paramecium pentaurelia TaxID=43138 RepID=A0A8S1S534_9CILI|nr:unnamed protein product [Paramecium pentaurelia]
MQIQLRNYQFSGSIFDYKIPQFKIRKSNKTSKKLKTSPLKNNYERSVESSMNKSNDEKMKIINLSLEVKNQTYNYKKPILYSCNINEDTSVNYQKPIKITNRLIPQQPKDQEKMLLLDRILIGQQFRRFSEKLNDSHRSKVNTLLKQQQSKPISQDLEIDPKGWTNKSSQSLL